jgi:regulator of cell morphogenesis and NO signaling
MPSVTRRTLGDIVAEQPAAARVLSEAGLDFCCHGDVDLDSACAAAGLDPDELADRIGDLEPDAGDDWADLSPPALAHHIVSTHHRFLRDELPSLEQLADKVADVHGARHPELLHVADLVREFRADLEPHMDKEERVLFPAIHALFDGGAHDFSFGTIDNPIRVMIAEHDRAGEVLAELRRVTGGFSMPHDGCGSYEALYRRLEAVEHDTHVHVHKENHVLFPAAVRREDAASTL